MDRLTAVCVTFMRHASMPRADRMSGVVNTRQRPSRVIERHVCHNLVVMGQKWTKVPIKNRLARFDMSSFVKNLLHSAFCWSWMDPQNAN